MNSWLRGFLPKDEYKERLYLYFLAEGMVVFFLMSVVMLFVQPQLEHGTVWTFLIPIISFVLYVYGRYILSGVEYTDIATEHEYKCAIRMIFKKSLVFSVLYLVVTIIVYVPHFPKNIIEQCMFALFVGGIHFVVQYFSLKYSYKKNKHILD